MGCMYKFCAVPFGLAPWLFTMISREFQSMLRRRGIAMHQFLDNWLGKVSLPQLWDAHRDLVIALCHSPRWLINYKKSELIPQDIYTFVGIHYNLIAFRAIPMGENWYRLRQLLQKPLDNPSLPAIVWQSVIGAANTQNRLVEYGRLHVRPFQWNLTGS